MNKPTCNDVADLIDLYAAHECDPAQEKAVRAHVAACADCRRTLDESRRLMGLLDVHFAQQDALSRLGARLKAEARPAPKVAPRLLRIHRFAAVAAMLLVTFGLGVLLFPTSELSQPLTLQLALLRTAKPEVPIVPGHNLQEKVKPSRGDKDGAKVLHGDKELANALEQAKKRGEWPLPPLVDLELVVTNPGRTPVELDVGGPGFRCELDVRGPPVARHAISKPAYVPFPRRKLTIAPGESQTLHLERLASQTGERVQYLYATKPGEYVVRVRLEVVVQRGGSPETLRLTAGPRTLPLP